MSFSSFDMKGKEEKIKIKLYTWIVSVNQVAEEGKENEKKKTRLSSFDR